MRDPWPYLEAIQRVIQGAGTRSAGQNEEQVTSKVVRDLRKMSNAALFGGAWRGVLSAFGANTRAI
jgi:hypothetical protein